LVPVGRPLLAAATTLAVVATAAGAVVGAPDRPVRRRRRIHVPGSWPRISILHISDLHVRRNNPRLSRARCTRHRLLAPPHAQHPGWPFE
jgi:hypothetical protein